MGISDIQKKLLGVAGIEGGGENFGPPLPPPPAFPGSIPECATNIGESLAKKRKISDASDMSIVSSASESPVKSRKRSIETRKRYIFAK
jgi:hypothetical protein